MLCRNTIGQVADINKKIEREGEKLWVGNIIDNLKDTGNTDML